MAFTTYIGKAVPDEDSVFYSSNMKEDGDKLFAEGISNILENISEGEFNVESMGDSIFISGATNIHWLRISKDGSIEFGMPG